MLSGYEPMLATARHLDQVPPGWAAEPKLDGWRAIVTIEDDGVTVRSRRGNDLTPMVPELGRLSSMVPPRTVLDGELIAGGGRASDFYTIGPRLRARSPVARQRWAAVSIAFSVFDVLQHAGENLCRVSWTERRAVLESLQLTGESWATVPVLDGALADIVHACHDLDLEGVVLKRRGSLYRPGERSKDWIKVKTPDRREHHAARRHER